VRSLKQLVTLPERQAATQLKDDRKLAWFAWGPEDGIPVLLCSGAAMSGSLSFGTTHLPALGLRLLAIS
jgi:hypothetical protein